MGTPARRGLSRPSLRRPNIGARTHLPRSVPYRPGNDFARRNRGRKAGSLLLDTGANNTIISPQAAGLATVQLRALQATRAGTGAEGDAVAREVDLRLAEHHWMNRRVLVMDLSDASKRMGTQVEGFLGQDILREFSSVRINYKNRTIEFEE